MVNLNSYDFVDFGCSTGGSMNFARKHLGGEKGLGIDIDPLKVSASEKLGEDALVADATDVAQFEGRVRFSILSHFLEHLPDYATVTKAIQTAVHISRSFIFIQQPWFDSDGDLLRHGLKFYWSDWSGHTMPLSTIHLYSPLNAMLQKGNIARFAIFGGGIVNNSDDDRIIPLQSGHNQQRYDPSKHGEKIFIDFERPAFSEQVVIIARKNPAVIDDICKRKRGLVKIFDSLN